MSKEYLSVGLDIGTAKTKVLILRKTSKEKLELAGLFKAKSLGVRKGTIDEVEKTSNVLKNIFNQITKETDRDISSVSVNLSGSHLFSQSSHGLVSVSRADHKISKEDIERVIEAAQIINLPSNNVIFDARPKNFIVDNMGDIKNPYGLKGVRLEVDVLALGGFEPYLSNTEKALDNAGLEIIEKIPSPIAAARAVLTEKQKRLGCAVLDIGAGISTIAAFKNNHLIYFNVLPIGSNNITSDIAIGLKIDPDIAEKIKVDHGACSFKGKDKKIKINIGEEEPLEFSKKFLVKIVKSRIVQIFEEIAKEMKKEVPTKSLPAGIVLTGGGANLKGIVSLSKKEFSLHSTLGKFEGPLKTEDDLSLATAYGLALSGMDILSEEKKEDGFFKKIGHKIKDFIKLFNP